MSNVPADSDPKSWHRYFAIEFNNRAWNLAEQESRTPEETRQMLEAANAAAAHWGVVGSPLHRMRAQMLLAQACALGGIGAFALQLAEEVRTYFLSHETPDWELALVHAIHANAAASAGDPDKHRRSFEAARLALAQVADEADKEVVICTLRQVPAP